MKRLLRNNGKPLVEMVAAAHVAWLYTYGLRHAPLWTAAVALAWLLLALHYWPEEKE